MKVYAFLVFVMLGVTCSTAQEKNIPISTVSLDNLITHVVENYGSKPNSYDGQRHVHLLVQLSQTGLDTEAQVMLRQSVKLLISRLGENDKISILGFSGLNGIALKLVSVTEQKKILNALTDFQSSIKELHPDGIALAREYAEEEFIDDVASNIIMILNPNAGNTNLTSTSNPSSASHQPSKKKNNAVLITAISLLPELIAIIKD